MKWLAFYCACCLRRGLQAQQVEGAALDLGWLGEYGEGGGVAEADDSFEALINPETYTLEYKLKFSESGQGHDA